ncbi:MAG: Rieske (2Fe-2S) protein [Anaerolineae bacterium]|jgi:nitrite reductase/ring-hydroxylating ferredoxin subunit
MQWIEVLTNDDLPPGTRRVSSVAGREVLLINREGEIHAVGSRCPHLQGKLENGEVRENGTIVCPRHHSVFDLETGAVQEWVPWPPVVGRALAAIARENALPVYPTKVEDGSIWVGIEDSE